MKTITSNPISVLLIIFITSFVFTNCKDDDDSGPNYADIDVVTGVVLVDDNGMPLGTWNIPNENKGNIGIFPNPCQSFLFLESAEAIANIWIIPANCVSENLNNNIPDLSLSLEYNISEIESKQVRKIEGPPFNNNSLVLDLSGLEAGFYRIFFETDSGVIHWQNFYNIDGGLGNLELTEYLDEACD